MTLRTRNNILSVQDYNPFGEEIRNDVTGGNNDKYKFTGKERDKESGLGCFSGIGWLTPGARYYDSEIGRWLSVDPLANKYPGWSPFNYCMNNPLGLVDPNGMEAGNYWGSDGTLLGNDGVDDGKNYSVSDANADEVSSVLNSTTSSIVGGENIRYIIASGMADLMPDYGARQGICAQAATAHVNFEPCGLVMADKVTGEQIYSPGKNGEPATGTGYTTCNPYIPSKEYPRDWNKYDCVTTVHDHPEDNNGFKFKQSPSDNDFATSGSQLKLKEMVISTQENRVYFYDKKGVGSSVPLSTFRDAR